VQTIHVTVRGGYSPNRISAQAGLPLRVVFNRQESGDCTSRVVFPDLGVSAELPAFATTTVDLSAQVPGEYAFACGMNMIHGVLSVSEVTEPTAALTLSDDAALMGSKDSVIATPFNQDGQQEATVLVHDGYHPSRVFALAGAPLTLSFDRRESGDCSSRVVISEFGVTADLKAFTTTTVNLPSHAPGHVDFTCGEQMMHGEIDYVVNAGAPSEMDHISAAKRTSPLSDSHVVSIVTTQPERDTEDVEATERRSEIKDLTRRVSVGAVLTLPVLFGVMTKDFFHAGWLPSVFTNPWFALAFITPVFLYTGWPIHRTAGLGSNIAART